MVVQKFEHVLRIVVIIFFMDLKKQEKIKLNTIVEIAIVHQKHNVERKGKESEPRNTSGIVNVSETLLETPEPRTKTAHPRGSSPIAGVWLNQSFSSLNEMSCVIC